VTGCTYGGIGFETCRVLALAGATVLVHTRSEAKSVATVKLLHDHPGLQFAQLKHVWCDMASLNDVVAFGGSLTRHDAPINIVVLNHGVLSTTLQLTADGFESTMGINVLSCYALFHALLPKLIASRTETAHSRVVWVASLMHAAGSGAFI